jgi:hypothetical protein
MTLLQTTPKKQDLPKIRQQRSLVRGVNLRTNANVISPSSFQARKGYMVQAYQEGKFLADPESRGKPRPNPMSDPAAMEGMMGMMKGNMAMMIPQSLIMGWINAFFSGFVISKSILFLWFVSYGTARQTSLPCCMSLCQTSALASTTKWSLQLLRRVTAICSAFAIRLPSTAGPLPSILGSSNMSTRMRGFGSLGDSRSGCVGCATLFASSRNYCTPVDIPQWLQ